MIDITSEILQNPNDYQYLEENSLQSEIIFNTCDRLVELINQIQEREVLIQEYLLKYNNQKKSTQYVTIKKLWINYCQFVCPQEEFDMNDIYTDIDSDDLFLSNTYDETSIDSHYVPDFSSVTSSDDVIKYCQQTNNLNNSAVVHLQKKYQLLNSIIEVIRTTLQSTGQQHSS